MRHTVETQKRSWHLWAALIFVAIMAWCSPDLSPEHSPNNQEQAK